ncbi:DoxX family protein [Stackebrandtia nassauensis]|uniref:DoxX family protein n=1 Tax=Stackebrandtia nassauensis (strain DSM 44728 / CIP 108903 / NRRL B-16338 / NBRC 102104 / LLR-40K-21) TaxID=446470 RepID=D3Q092_STANL|nr:DoxX family protein [Stackebrandtia nassauensis]ADD45621.1 DoxX family protein [Stackebrandtia nassauensis DSM 44728]
MSDNATPAQDTKRPGKALNIILWVLQGLLAAFFVFASAPKLLGDPTAVEMFGKIDFGDWFRYLTGIVELAGAIGLVIPRLSSLAASGLAIVMVCATVANLTALEMAWAAPQTIVLAALFVFIAWGRRDQNKRLLAMFKGSKTEPSSV